MLEFLSETQKRIAFNALINAGSAFFGSLGVLSAVGDGLTWKIALSALIGGCIGAGIAFFTTLKSAEFVTAMKKGKKKGCLNPIAKMQLIGNKYLL